MFGHRTKSNLHQNCVHAKSPSKTNITRTCLHIMSLGQWRSEHLPDPLARPRPHSSPRQPESPVRTGQSWAGQSLVGPTGRRGTPPAPKKRRRPRVGTAALSATWSWISRRSRRLRHPCRAARRFRRSSRRPCPTRSARSAGARCRSDRYPSPSARPVA